MLMYLFKQVNNATIFISHNKAQLHVSEEFEIHEITVTQN